MKSEKEIFQLLIYELVNHFDNIKNINHKSIYYNEILGDTSFLLAGLLESLLKKNLNELDKKKWIDDSLITKVVIQNNKLKIQGVMIWGVENSTKQWTDPFSFEIELLKDGMSPKNFEFLFCDLEKREISYEDFRANRDYWNKSTRNWKYVINENKSFRLSR